MSAKSITIDFLLAGLQRLEPERAHALALWGLRQGWHFASDGNGAAAAAAYPRLASEVWGLRFANPLGLAAGFDKNGEVVAPLLSLGFGFVEAGTVTPRAQKGNAKPRLWRVPAERALHNRLGLNNDGAAAVARRLRSLRRGGVVGINLGANADSADAVADYIKGMREMRGLADYVTLNISCPNVGEGRALQESERLRGLLERIAPARESGVPLLLKLAPDLSEAQEEAIGEVALGGGVDGLIVSNTMPGRRGGVSGRPLFAPSTRALRRMHVRTGGRVPLIGVGGVFTAEEAYEKIRAGASLVQIYTALVYEGPAVVSRILSGLDALLQRDGFASVGEAVGRDASGHDRQTRRRATA